MLTLKFGGTSMANARRILSSADIIISRGKGERLSVIVSAVAGISNSLQAAIDDCTARTINSDYVHDIKKIHEEICFELQSSFFDSAEFRRT